ncbi:hypothetical protein [Hydrogenophaga sp.]|uniref:hypothetical protein n=1 Tax=Hydrogenophaga sp. TaxID=1904254 RepID=UPI002725D8D1|nr:hypothetical protein [Hydrogenophaga sp.]MDO9504961.1 hypothetical protein [Hydrogenophaga sp.]
MNTKPKPLDIRIGQLVARLADQQAVKKEKLRKKKQREAFLLGDWLQVNRPEQVAEILIMVAAKKS